MDSDDQDLNVDDIADQEHNDRIPEDFEGGDEEHLEEVEDGLGALPPGNAQVEDLEGVERNQNHPNSFDALMWDYEEFDQLEDFGVDPPDFVQMALDNHRQTDDEEAEGGQDSERQTFDSSLPSLHSYLGVGKELSGRTLLEEEVIQKLPLIPLPSFTLYPNQIFPLSIASNERIAMFKDVIDTNRTFGVLNYMSEYKDNQLGTTAEIFEYKEANGIFEGIGRRLMIKAIGRQRFKVRRSWIEGSTKLMGNVVLLPEISLPSPFTSCRLRTMDRLVSHKFFPIGDHSEEEESGAESKKSWHVSIRHHPRHLESLSPLPTVVWNMYNSQILVEKVQNEVVKSKLTSSRSRIPFDPSALSWWVAANLPLNDVQRYNLLSINCPEQRLRVELGLLSKCRVLVCKLCSQQLAEQSHIMPMSVEGPQGAYVNPAGHVHETVSLSQVRNLNLVGSPSTEFSWFPGYSWTICECSQCYTHIGWKFIATDANLLPKKFYLLTRKSILAVVQEPQHEHIDEEEEERRDDYAPIYVNNL